MDRVNIDDDIFLLKPKGWLEEFAEKYPKEIGLPLYCNIRPELVNEKTGYLLKKIGCYQIIHHYHLNDSRQHNYCIFLTFLLD